VAQVIVECLDHDATIGPAITLYGGETPIEDALRPSG
jgi:hypothetical protein